MSILLAVLLGIFMGIIFGFALEKSKVFDPATIVSQFQFRNFTMLKVFLTAITTGLIIFSIFFSIGFDRLVWKTTILSSDIIGGILLGIGTVIAGACPGTVFAQIGAGYKDAWFTLLGAITGSIFFVITKPFILQLLGTPWPNEKLTLEGILGLNFWSIAIVCVIFMIGTLYLIEKKFPQNNNS